MSDQFGQLPSLQSLDITRSNVQTKGRYLIDAATTAIEHDAESDCLFCIAGKQLISSTVLCAVCGTGRYQSENIAAPAVCDECCH